MTRPPHPVTSLALVVAMGSMALPAWAGWPVAQARAEAPGIASRMEQVIQAYASKHQFMGSVLVAREGDVLFSKGFGAANLEWDVPNTPATRFRLASLTKQFTAASILLLEERGKLSLKDPVKRHLPEAPAAWDHVTLHHLLTHTSGIPSFTSFPEYRLTEALEATPEQLVARFRDKPLDFPPGHKFSYSNSGYTLLGFLIEKVTGQSYASFVQENIFGPLGMKDSGSDANAAILPRRASGYEPGADGPRNAGYIHMSIPVAAGSLYSTTGDLLLWVRGLFGGKLLKPASLEKMTTPFKEGYAFGLRVHSKHGLRTIEHNGGIEGFNTHLSYFPETKVTIAVLGNLNGTAPDAIAGQLGAVAHGQPVYLPGERKEIRLDPKVLEGFTGRFQLTQTALLTISRRQDRLFAQITGQPPFELFAFSPNGFFLKVNDAQIEFATDPAGKATSLTLTQNGRQKSALRVEGEPEASTKPKDAGIGKEDLPRR